MRVDNPDCEFEQGLKAAGSKRDLVVVVVEGGTGSPPDLRRVRHNWAEEEES